MNEQPPVFDIGPEQRDRMIEEVAQRIFRLGMATPAIIFLDGHRHLGRVAGNALHFISPGLGVFVPDIDHYGAVLQEKESIGILVDRLQELEMERVEQERALRKERKERARARKMKAREATREAGERPKGTDREEDTDGSA